MNNYICQNLTDSHLTLRIGKAKYELQPHKHKESTCLLNEDQSEHSSVINLKLKGWVLLKPANVLSTKESVSKVVDDVTRNAELKAKKALAEFDKFLKSEVAVHKTAINKTLKCILKDISMMRDKIVNLTSLIEKSSTEVNLILDKTKRAKADDSSSKKSKASKLFK